MYNEEQGKQKYLAYLAKSKALRSKTSYRKKIIISGSFVEEYRYEKPVIYGQKIIRIRKKRIKREQTKMRGDALRRTRMNIMRLVNSNPDLIAFLTLTFDESKVENKQDITEFEKCNYWFRTFILRLKYNFPDIKYLTVPEFQGDYYFRTKIKKEFGGAIHYHLLLNRPIGRSQMEKIWQHGFVKINKIKAINNVGLYVSKYLSKEAFNKKYFGKKKFFCSKNINRPREFKGPDCKAALANFPPLEIIYEKKFRNKYRGEISANLYKLPTAPTADKNI